MLIYAIALTMKGKAKKELTELRARFGTNMNYSIEPHVTIIFRFTLKTDIRIIQNRLSEIATQTRPFMLVLNGIRYWEGKNNVAYIAVQNQLPVYNLQATIIDALEGLISADTTFNLQNFIAHLTINEHVPGESLSNLKKELSAYHLEYRMNINSFALFAAAPNEKGEEWKPVRIFCFPKTK
jgi:2'-5' RNA ligase